MGYSALEAEQQGTRSIISEESARAIIKDRWEPKGKKLLADRLYMAWSG